MKPAITYVDLLPDLDIWTDSTPEQEWRIMLLEREALPPPVSFRASPGEMLCRNLELRQLHIEPLSDSLLDHVPGRHQTYAYALSAFMLAGGGSVAQWVNLAEILPVIQDSLRVYLGEKLGKEVISIGLMAGVEMGWIHRSTPSNSVTGKEALCLTKSGQEFVEHVFTGYQMR